jgi:hypothetical protein
MDHALNEIVGIDDDDRRDLPRLEDVKRLSRQRVS